MSDEHVCAHGSISTQLQYVVQVLRAWNSTVFMYRTVLYGTVDINSKSHVVLSLYSQNMYSVQHSIVVIIHDRSTVPVTSSTCTRTT